MMLISLKKCCVRKGFDYEWKKYCLGSVGYLVGNGIDYFGCLFVDVGKWNIVKLWMFDKIL